MVDLSPRRAILHERVAILLRGRAVRSFQTVGIPLRFLQQHGQWEAIASLL
jgi:hypothetical protein